MTLVKGNWAVFNTTDGSDYLLGQVLALAPMDGKNFLRIQIIQRIDYQILWCGTEDEVFIVLVDN